jgi:hypothetical protein
MTDSLSTIVRKIARDYDSDIEMEQSFASGLQLKQLKVLKKACILNQNRKPRVKSMSGHDLSPKKFYWQKAAIKSMFPHFWRDCPCTCNSVSSNRSRE